MSQFVPWESHWAKALPALNYSLIFPAGILLFFSFLCYRSSHSQGKRDHPSAKPPQTSRFSATLEAMYNYFQHQRGAMAQLDLNTKTSACQSDVDEGKMVTEVEPNSVEQPYDVFLVLDVEATCLEGAGFHWPNEVLEWPVCLMKWTDKEAGKASTLKVVDEFRSFVKPSWAPELSPFCTQLTGITQAQIDKAPLFPTVLAACAKWLIKNGLIDPVTGKHLVRFCWCSDGPFDIQNFVVKQCFISNIPIPEWLRGDVLDVRKEVIFFSEGMRSGFHRQPRPRPGVERKSMNIPVQLRALGLDPFEGRQHSGIDDTRNIARILAELGRRGIRLQPNIVIDPRRRWHWMGKKGEILEHTLAYPDQ